MHRFLLVAFVSLMSTGCFAAELNPKDAKDHAGENGTVCGAVVSTKYAPNIKGEPTFLNFDEFFPNQIFTVVIWGADRTKFAKPPEEMYRGRNVCVEGLIQLYKGIPEIVVNDPDRLKFR